MNNPKMSTKNKSSGKLLVLHGNRQTGQLLLGRMDKLRKKLLQAPYCSMELATVDAPFPTHPQEDPNNHLRTWWHRHNNNNTYEGLEESMELVQSVWNSTSSIDHDDDDDPSPFVGLLGFSQGARFGHLLAESGRLRGLRFVILVAGYDDAPLLLPDNFSYSSSSYTTTINNNNNNNNNLISVPSLHVWGETDQLIAPEQSEALTRHYHNPVIYIHTGGHHIPMRADSVRTYLDFIQRHSIITAPDEETALQQYEEVEALRAIFPDEFHLLSKCRHDDNDNNNNNNNNDEPPIYYEHPISYEIDLTASDEGVWPPHPVKLHVTYPHNYLAAATNNDNGDGDDASSCDGAAAPLLPILKLIHNNNGLEFSSNQVAACLQATTMAALQENGNPCVLSCLYAARNYFESGAMIINTSTTALPPLDNNKNNNKAESSDEEVATEPSATMTSLIKPSSSERIRKSNLQGLEIAERILMKKPNNNNASSDPTTNKSSSESTSSATTMGKGGSWMYTIGLVGKPSAGKSTFFNTASGFARQRHRAAAAAAASDDTDYCSNVLVLGGAAMAPHPFTTIDPNIGFCLVPAPAGSCPEEEEEDDKNDASATLVIGSTHGRDCDGRRLLPVLLKDVAGLVPGAYQGRGRGNQFLNDLTDADVLIHVLDASGMSDTEGNVVVVDDEYIEQDGVLGGGAATGTKSSSSETLHPIHDMAWIRTELIEWLYTNLSRKWETIRRKGRNKLMGMFSGYGQPRAMTERVLDEIESYLEQQEGRVRVFDTLDEWDEADVHRLVSAFLGVRFPIALALNKMDLPSSKKYIDDILAALPLHGTHAGTPMAARKEMLFVRQHIEAALKMAETADKEILGEAEVPRCTWNCLQSAIGLREPVLVFPVCDFTSYAPVPGMFKYAPSDPSLPSPGMIATLQAAGGTAPTEWVSTSNQYAKQGSKKTSSSPPPAALRDVIMMKPGSTVEDVFLTLKRLGALSGEFVRAEAAGHIGIPAKPVPKHQVVTKKNRILKIMTNKRTAWQNA